MVVAIALAGCSDWAPIHNARDFEGQRVKVEAAGHEEIVIDEVVTCDDDGFVIASQASDCHEKRTFDTRRDKVLAIDKDTKSSVGLVVAGVLASIFIPAAIVGSAILSAH